MKPVRTIPRVAVVMLVVVVLLVVLGEELRQILNAAEHPQHRRDILIGRFGRRRAFHHSLVGAGHRHPPSLDWTQPSLSAVPTREQLPPG
jgi:hypothetical protein